MQPQIPYAQAAWFRAQRSGLVTPFASLPQAAAGILGAQAQIEVPARWALSLRTAGHPDAMTVRRALLEDRTLVRAWGQRDTVHLYAVEDWHLIARAQELWPVTSRQQMATDNEIVDFVAVIDTLHRPFTRSDLLQAAPGRLVDAFANNPVNNDPPARMAISRLIWHAGHLGFLSSIDNIGREQAYVARRWWLPTAPWPDLTPTQAAIALVRRYLQVWGPARVQDAAHYFGARITETRTWFAALHDELVPLQMDGVPDHYVLRDDLEALCQAPPNDHAAWPARLLPAYDTQMMTHANKDPLLHSAEDRKRVWDKAAIVNPTVFHRGRFVATWKHAVVRKHVQVTHDALSGSDHPAVASQIDQALRRDGAALAQHLGLPLANA